MSSLETLDHLRPRGFASGDRVNRRAIAEACKAVLLDRVVATEAEIDEKALYVFELRFALLGEAPR